MSTNIQNNNFGASPIVEIYVGAEKKLYRYHKMMLCQGAPFFATSLKDDWNGKTLKVEVPDVNIDTFETVMGWIYKLSRPADLINSKDFIGAVARLYKFVDYLMMEREKNEIVDRTVKRLARSNHVTFAELNVVYDLGISDTKLFTLVLRDCVRNFVKNPAMFNDSSCFRSIKDPALFTLVLGTVRDYNSQPWTTPTTPDCHKHHEHINTSPCVTATGISTSGMPFRYDLSKDLMMTTKFIGSLTQAPSNDLLDLSPLRFRKT